MIECQQQSVGEQMTGPFCSRVLILLTIWLINLRLARSVLPETTTRFHLTHIPFQMIGTAIEVIENQGWTIEDTSIDETSMTMDINVGSITNKQSVERVTEFIGGILEMKTNTSPQQQPSCLETGGLFSQFGCCSAKDNWVKVCGPGTQWNTNRLYCEG